jgi:hypothetical protein
MALDWPPWVAPGEPKGPFSLCPTGIGGIIEPYWVELQFPDELPELRRA